MSLSRLKRQEDGRLSYRMKRAGPSQLPMTPPRKPRLPWAALLLRVFAIDVLACPCGGQRQVLAFITEVPMVREILDHLQLPSMPLPWASAQAPPQLELEA